MENAAYNTPSSELLTGSFKEAIESPEFNESKGKCLFIVGKDRNGKVLIEDLGNLLNLLVIGAGGCGKTSFVDNMIMSFVFKHSPNELQLILLSPKPNELGVYSALPHLYCPLVTESEKALGIIRWINNEVEHRYARLLKMGFRRIEQYNSKAEPENKIPRLVVIIDGVELLQLGCGDNEEYLYTALCRSHEVGIHFVITVSHLGIKTFSSRCQSAIPNRVSFRTVTAQQSRVGIGVEGAERLAGIGKCLLSTIFKQGPVELQANKVEQTDIENVINHFSGDHTPKHEIAELLCPNMEHFNSTDKNSNDQMDDLLPDAVRTVMDSNSASISYIQRRLKVGYARAARLVDIMERMNIVSGFDGSKPRRVLIDEAGYYALFLTNENEKDGEDSSDSNKIDDNEEKNDVRESSIEADSLKNAEKKIRNENQGRNDLHQAQIRASELTGIIARLKTQKDSLGLFKRKEKMRIQEQIDQATAELERIRNRFRF